MSSSSDQDAAPEGSMERRHARMMLYSRAEQARQQGDSYASWLDNERVTLLSSVTDRDLDSIFQLVWKNGINQ